MSTIPPLEQVPALVIHAPGPQGEGRGEASVQLQAGTCQRRILDVPSDMLAKARFVLIDPTLMFTGIGAFCVLALGWDAEVIFKGASVSTMLTVAMRLQETIWPPGGEPTPPGSR